MYYDIKEVMSFLKTFDEYGINAWGGFSSEEVDTFISSIDYNKVPKFDWETGATKLVLIPLERDYVIKIPFSGEWKYGDFFSFNGAESSNYDDYCEAEMIIYEEAKEQGFEHLFLPLEYLGRMFNYPVYVQQKVEIYESEGKKKYFSEDSKERYKSSKFGKTLSLPLDWKYACLEEFETIEEFDRFIEYIRKEGIAIDLHQGNVGYLNKRAIIIDYGGYSE